MLIGLSAFSFDGFSPCTSSVRDIYYLEITNAIFDEIHVRERIDFPISNTRESWQPDTRLLAKFKGNLEAGNIDNDGLQIEKFALKRKRYDELDWIIVGYLSYENGKTVEFIDYTQPNDKLIYSVCPVAENGLLGKDNLVEIESDFVGFYIVDKDEQNNPNPQRILVFDTIVGNNIPMVDTQLEQGRVELRTLSKYPIIFYTDNEFHRFSLQASFIPEENQRSNKLYEKLLNMIREHKPYIVKGSDGSLYVMDISNPKRSVSNNSYKSYDWITVSIDCVEVDEVKRFMEEE